MKNIFLMLVLLLQVTFNAHTQQPTLNEKSDSLKYAPIKVEGNTISLTHSKIELDKNGFPKQIQTLFNPSSGPHKLLYENIHFHFLRKNDGKNIVLKDGGVQFLNHNKKGKRNKVVKWKSTNRNDSLMMEVEGSAKPDGSLTYTVKVTALQAISLKDVTMHIPFIPTLPTNMMGFGIGEGKRPEKVEWKWDGPFKNQNGAWLGNKDAGLYYSLKRGDWVNDYIGGVTIGIKGSSMLANNYTGEHEMKKGDVRSYNFKVLVKPFQSIEK